MIAPNFGPRIATERTPKGNLVSLKPQGQKAGAQRAVRRTLAYLEAGNSALAFQEIGLAARDFYPIHEALGCPWKAVAKLEGACQYTYQFGDMSGRHLKAAREAAQTILGGRQ